MALKGTIKDFGVADIFQLISQQGKTGVLVFSNDVDEVRVYFKDGSVVRASNTLRTAQMLLGSLMVRAAVVSDEQLQEALREQQRTLKRLGAVMVELGYVDVEMVKDFATLQMTETIYALFEWKFGTYEFESVDVEPSPEGVLPIRAETIVMNGIRMTDEWPSIREKIPSYTWRVEAVRPLPEEEESSASDSDEFDFSALGEGGGTTAYNSIGAFERKIFGLITPERTVQEIIDRSRLGEFEACRALSTLMTEGYIRVIKPTPIEDEDAPKVRVDPAMRMRRIGGILGRIVVSAGLVVVGAMLAGRAAAFVGGKNSVSDLTYAPRPVERRLAEAQMHRLRRAIEVYRYERGAYPTNLARLVEVGLLQDDDIRFPFEANYFYRVVGETYSLLPPVH
ncbi:MAG: DUF4388 domain-containing protein [Deltaproteobacteria bacterium]|jgi:hypothetical protein